MDIIPAFEAVVPSSNLGGCTSVYLFIFIWINSLCRAQ